MKFKVFYKPQEVSLNLGFVKISGIRKEKVSTTKEEKSTKKKKKGNIIFEKEYEIDDFGNEFYTADGFKVINLEADARLFICGVEIVDFYEIAVAYELWDKNIKINTCTVKIFSPRDKYILTDDNLEGKWLPDEEEKKNIFYLKEISNIKIYKNDLVFSSNDPVQIFFKDRFVPFWRFGFTGYITEIDDFRAVDQQRITLTVSDVTKFLTQKQFAENPAIVDPYYSRLSPEEITRKRLSIMAGKVSGMSFYDAVKTIFFGLTGKNIVDTEFTSKQDITANITDDYMLPDVFETQKNGKFSLVPTDPNSKIPNKYLEIYVKSTKTSVTKVHPKKSDVKKKSKEKEDKNKQSDTKPSKKEQEQNEQKSKIADFSVSIVDIIKSNIGFFRLYPFYYRPIKEIDIPKAETVDNANVDYRYIPITIKGQTLEDLAKNYATPQLENRGFTKDYLIKLNKDLELIEKPKGKNKKIKYVYVPSKEEIKKGKKYQTFKVPVLQASLLSTSFSIPYKKVDNIYRNFVKRAFLTDIEWDDQLGKYTFNLIGVKGIHPLLDDSFVDGFNVTPKLVDSIVKTLTDKRVSKDYKIRELNSKALSKLSENVISKLTGYLDLTPFEIVRANVMGLPHTVFVQDHTLNKATVNPRLILVVPEVLTFPQESEKGKATTLIKFRSFDLLQQPDSYQKAIDLLGNQLNVTDLVGYVTPMGDIVIEPRFYDSLPWWWEGDEETGVDEKFIEIPQPDVWSFRELEIKTKRHEVLVKIPPLVRDLPLTYTIPETEEVSSAIVVNPSSIPTIIEVIGRPANYILPGLSVTDFELMWKLSYESAPHEIKLDSPYSRLVFDGLPFQLGDKSNEIKSKIMTLAGLKELQKEGLYIPDKDYMRKYGNRKIIVRDKDILLNSSIACEDYARILFSRFLSDVNKLRDFVISARPSLFLNRPVYIESRDLIATVTKHSLTFSVKKSFLSNLQFSFIRSQSLMGKYNTTILNVDLQNEIAKGYKFFPTIGVLDWNKYMLFRDILTGYEIEVRKQRDKENKTANKTVTTKKGK